MAKGDIGDVARRALAAGDSNEEALAAVLLEHPGAKTKVASIKWYRSQLRRRARRGEREPGGEGAPRERCPARRGGGMTPELAATLRENAERRVKESHAKFLGEQDKRERERGSMADRATMYLNAAAHFKEEHGRWPSPRELTDLRLVASNRNPPRPSPAPLYQQET